MSDFDEILEYLEPMHQIANRETRNRDDANDVVQRVCLAVMMEIKNGREITNIKNYLASVTYKESRRFYEEEDRYGSLEYSTHGPVMLSHDDVSEFEDYGEYLEKIMIIRQELAFLEKKYREPVVLRFFHKDTLEQISEILKTPLNTIKDRIDKGKEIMLEGFKETKSYLDSGYEPRYLFITFGGRIGKNGEPRNIITNLIDHNVLITVAYTPRTIVEISKIMSVATAYIEESVKKLLKYGLLEKSGKSYYTTFLVLFEADLINLQNISKKVVDETFDKVKGIFDDLLNEFRKLAILTEFSKEQQYLFAINTVCSLTQSYLINSLNLLKVEDYPEKFDIGKWMIDVGFVTISEDTIPPSYLYLHGPWVNEFFNGICTIEYDSAIGKTYRADFSLSISNKERATVLYDISKEIEIDPNYAPLIRDFIRLGFIKTNLKKEKSWDSCYPVLSKTEFKELSKVSKINSEKYIAKIGKFLIDVVKKNKIDHPKWIDSNQTFLNLACLTAVPLLYSFKASEEGIIDIDKDKNYPLYLIVK